MLELINTYIYAGWEQVPYLIIAVVMNVWSGILATDAFSWSVLGKKLGKKGAFYGFSLLALHAICHIPFDGVALYQMDFSFPFTEADLNVFKTLNFAAVLYMAVKEVLSTNDNIHAVYGSYFIPEFISKPLKKYAYPQSS